MKEQLNTLIFVQVYMTIE